jgi:hypothetical protein
MSDYAPPQPGNTRAVKNESGPDIYCPAIPEQKPDIIGQAHFAASPQALSAMIRTGIAHLAPVAQDKFDFDRAISFDEHFFVHVIFSLRTGTEQP